MRRPCYGPYVSDRAIAEKIKTLVIGTGKPLFVFVITMENHGPLHWEQVSPSDEEHLYAEPPPAGWDDLTIYLRHLANADKMIGSLRRHLEASPREALMCFFGDHVPILPKVFEALGHMDASTEYFIWKNRPSPGAAGSEKLKVEHLPALLLRHAGRNKAGTAQRLLETA